MTEPDLNDLPPAQVESGDLDATLDPATMVGEEVDDDLDPDEPEDAA